MNEIPYWIVQREWKRADAIHRAILREEEGIGIERLELTCTGCGRKTYIACVLKHHHCKGCLEATEFVDCQGEIWFAMDANDSDPPAPAALPPIEHPPLPEQELF